MRLAILIVFSVCARAQSGIDRPFLGQMIDRQHDLRLVYGASGSFSVEAPIAERVISSACSRTLCLAKTESALLSAGTVTASPRGDAMIGLDATGATVYFPETQQFERWQDGSLTILDLRVDGKVLALRSTPLNIAVERSGIVRIVAADGSVLDSLPPEAGAVLLLPDSVVYATSDSLVLRRNDGSELRFPAPGVVALEALGDGYVEAVGGNVLYALRTVAGGERLFQLPQSRQDYPR